jgi:UDP-N-acetylglucosamine 2-epimerase
MDLITVLDACAVVITDSGGLQKEAYMLRRPTVTVRDSTEWVETVESGWNRLCEPYDPEFTRAVNAALNNLPEQHPDFYGTYGVCERICGVLEARSERILMEAGV